MRKLSRAELARIMNDGAVALVSMANERDCALQKLATLERRVEAEKLASSMHEKGVKLDQTHGELSAYIEKEARKGRLDTIKDAVDMLVPNMGIKTASLTSDEHHAVGLHPFEQHILGGRLGDVG